MRVDYTKRTREAIAKSDGAALRAAFRPLGLSWARIGDPREPRIPKEPSRVPAEIATGLPILGSVGGLIAGHTLIVIPWCVRLVSASLAGMDRSTEEAAQNLGATPIVTFFRVTLPAIRPGIVAAAMFGFVMSFGNLEMSLFLVGPGRTTLPIAILQYLEWKLDPTIAAVSVLQILIIGSAMLVTDHYVKIARVV